MEEIPRSTEQFIYARDFCTVDSVLGKRFYVFAIISHKTREIARVAITENPTREASGSS